MKARHAVAALFLFHLAVGVSAAEAQGRRNRNLITEEEITKNPASDAYELVKSLRPAWLTNARGISSGGLNEGAGIVVYVDGIRTGGVDELSNVSTDRIKEVRFLNARDATTRYGTGHPIGAIEITTRR